MEEVGQEAREPRFAVDRMLGRLARWLRVLGHDVAYGSHLGGRTAVGCARRDGRILLTRDTRLLRDPHLPPHLFITSDHFREQLREVAAHYALGTGASFRRCLECNRLLEEVSREQARDRVPPYVWAASPRFLRCTGCGRLFWPATHQEHMRRELAALGLPGEIEAS